MPIKQNGRPTSQLLHHSVLTAVEFASHAIFAGTKAHNHKHHHARFLSVTARAAEWQSVIPTSTVRNAS